ncbi:dihydrofolate reductase family protein [Haladaptatus caseinilyticus]|uniref:dihydrofolate reductase family protein n=1 Tax=Haladaptatus caseinilyticus TaxID=2993314 RepID=UPI00224B0A11|nr:dihydrofolate reductase family protein [Haladaptatus caseinilyticus]
MRNVIVGEFLTLDGVMQAPGGPDEDAEGGFEHGGWQMPYIDEVFEESVSEGIATSDAFLLGRKTYEIFAAYWPTATNDGEFADLMNDIDKYVASRTLEEVEWENSTLLEGDAAEAVAELKRQPGGDLRVFGSGEFVQTLMEHDLVDEYQLMIHPLILGSGKRLFRQGDERIDLELLDTKTTGTGVVILRYRVDR